MESSFYLNQLVDLVDQKDMTLTDRIGYLVAAITNYRKALDMDSMSINQKSEIEKEKNNTELKLQLAEI